MVRRLHGGGSSAISSGAGRFMVVLFTVVLLAASADAANYSVGLSSGYKTGVAVRLNSVLLDVARGFPLGVGVAVGYSWLEPGRAEEARQIFINDATNGTPEKGGGAWELRLDFLYRVRLLGWERTYILAGIRRSMFTANFKFVGGNEDFNVSSNQWGWGLGARGLFSINDKVDLSVEMGFDHYFPADLYGHDTTYSPGGEDINPRQTFTYKDADRAINQPKFQPIFLIGIGYSFGR